jgi:hypothetical protein
LQGRKARVEFVALGLRERELFYLRSDAIPDLLDELKPLRNAEAIDAEG